MMNELIRVERYRFHENWTISRHYFQGKLVGYIVEDEIREEKVFGETAIPEGFYLLALRHSPKFSSSFKWSESKKTLIERRHLPKDKKDAATFADHQLIWIKDVPDFQYILMHWGNTDLDSHGCLILGDRLGIVKGREAVLNSRNFYKKWYPDAMPLIAAGGQGIRIVNVAPPLLEPIIA